LEKQRPDPLRLVIHAIPPSNNRFIGRDARWAYQEEKRRWEILIRAALGRYKPSAPFKRAEVSIRYWFPDKRRRDPDNYSGKMLLDGLTRAGVIADDSFQAIRLELLGGWDPEQPRTEILIRPLSDLPGEA